MQNLNIISVDFVKLLLGFHSSGSKYLFDCINIIFVFIFSLTSILHKYLVFLALKKELKEQYKYVREGWTN